MAKPHPQPYRRFAVKVLLVAALVGFLINLAIGLLVFKQFLLTLGFAIFGLLLGAGFGLLEMLMRRMESSRKVR